MAVLHSFIPLLINVLAGFFSLAVALLSNVSKPGTGFAEYNPNT
jgi:hypothetical protein